jgi:excisionase family DNA binding protein
VGTKATHDGSELPETRLAPQWPEVRLLRRDRVTLTEAAVVLGVTAATLRQQIHNGKLRAVKRGRDWWVTAREVERYRQDSRRT